MIRVRRDVKDRKGIIGGSGWAKCLGLSTYGTEHDAYMDYIGKEREFTEKQLERMQMGSDLEDFIAGQCEKKYGVKLRKSPYAYLCEKDPKKRLHCHPDRIALDLEDGKRVAYEIKSSSTYDRRWDEESGKIPMEYLVQVYSYFACDVSDVVYLVRFADNTLTRYRFEPNWVTINKIVESIIKWADSVDNGYIPKASSYDEAKELYFFDTEGVKEADDIIYSKWEEWKAEKAKKKECEDKIDMLAKEIIEYLVADDESGANRNLVHGTKKLCSYYKLTRTDIDKKKLALDYPEASADCRKQTSYMVLK